jgi:hypothetical protein
MFIVVTIVYGRETKARKGVGKWCRLAKKQGSIKNGLVDAYVYYS